MSRIQELEPLAEPGDEDAILIARKHDGKWFKVLWATIKALARWNAGTTRSSATASASTVLTSLIRHAVAAGEIVAGSEYEFSASLRLINTTAATNSVVTLRVGATNVLVLTQANGTAAAASPGAAVWVVGTITFYSATQAEAVINYVRSQASAANVVLNTSAPITVSAAGATTIELLFNTSAGTATFICRQAHMKRVR